MFEYNSRTYKKKCDKQDDTKNRKVTLIFLAPVDKCETSRRALVTQWMC